MDRFFQREPVKLAAMAICASLLTLGVQKIYEDRKKSRRKKELTTELWDLHHGSSNVAPQSSSIVGIFDEGLIREQLARNYALFDEQGMAKVRNSFVVIVGCGGVGSWAAIMLARS